MRFHVLWTGWVSVAVALFSLYWEASGSNFHRDAVDSGGRSSWGLIDHLRQMLLQCLY
jgi:hypothetical protein